LRHCSTIRLVAGSIADAVIWIFYCHYPSGRTRVLDSSQPLIEVRIRGSVLGYRRPERRADKLTAFLCSLPRNSGSLKPPWAPGTCSFTSFYIELVAQSVQRLAKGWMVWGSNPCGGEIFRTRPYRPWGLLSLLHIGFRVSFPGANRPGRGIYHSYLTPRLKK
jgi:hypothetical protein